MTQLQKARQEIARNRDLKQREAREDLIRNGFNSEDLERFKEKSTKVICDWMTEQIENRNY